MRSVTRSFITESPPRSVSSASDTGDEGDDKEDEDESLGRTVLQGSHFDLM